MSNNPTKEEQTSNKNESQKNYISRTDKKDKIKEKEEGRKFRLSDNEYTLLKIAEYEYNDLFPEILKNSKSNFFSTLQRYILINISPKNLFFPNGTIDKILKIIDNYYYHEDYSRILNLINYINKYNTYLTFNGHNFLAHCSRTRMAMHTCGDKLLLLDNGRYLLCKNCNLIYYYRNVLLLCDFCKKEYFTEIKEISAIDKYCFENNLRQATWAKYHCNAIMNDTMKCQQCSNVLYINQKNALLCLNCKTEINQFDVKWKCLICSKNFVSEAKEYDPFIFKIIKLIVKRTLFKGIEAKPPYVPCCDISSEQINTYKFYHKKECNGLLYEGEMDNKRIVVCSKCHMLNYYYNHFWLCPICKRRFNLKEYLQKNNNNNDYSNNNTNNNNSNSISEKNNTNNTNNSNNNNNNFKDEINDNNKRPKFNSIKEFKKKKSLIEDLSPDLKSSSISIFASKGKGNVPQGALLNKFGLHKLMSKEEISNEYKTNETSNKNKEKEKEKEEDVEEEIVYNRKYSKSLYYSNKNVNKNLNKNLFYKHRNSKFNNDIGEQNVGEETEINNNNNNNNFVKINKEYDNEIVVHSISPIKQFSNEIKVNKNQLDYISNDSAKNVIRRTSFNRISSFGVRKIGEKNNNKILMGNDSHKKDLMKVYNNYEENDYNNNNNMYSEYKSNNNNVGGGGSNEKMKYIEDANNKKLVEGNITVPFNLGKEEKLFPNNIHINVNLNLNINNNNQFGNVNNNSNANYNNNVDNFMPSPKKIRPRINSAKDISSKRIINPKVSNNFYKLNSLDIVTNNLNINDYNIIKQIGEGTFGKIFEVENENHYHFALKKLLANSIKEMEMLKSEYELLLGLEGLNINLIHIYGIENKKLDKTTYVVYVLMELAICDWEKEIQNREKRKLYYSEEELIIILKNLVYTFAELQRHNISHRDIKPQNILLCKDNILKIADFGEAKEARNRNNIDTIRQTIRGTELYMSPILFDSLKKKKRNGKYILHNSYKSDVFSLGFCIFLAATLKIDSLYVIREIKDMNSLEKEVYRLLKKRYSDKLINVIIAMLEIDEKNRVDFIELENIVQKL